MIIGHNMTKALESLSLQEAFETIIWHDAQLTAINFQLDFEHDVSQLTIIAQPKKSAIERERATLELVLEGLDVASLQVDGRVLIENGPAGNISDARVDVSQSGHVFIKLYLADGYLQASGTSLRIIQEGQVFLYSIK
jgi:hypothetical protein